MFLARRSHRNEPDTRRVKAGVSVLFDLIRNARKGASDSLLQLAYLGKGFSKSDVSFSVQQIPKELLTDLNKLSRRLVGDKRAGRLPESHGLSISTLAGLNQGCC